MHITDEWIIETMEKNDWCLNEIAFVYPGGIVKPELAIPTGERVCASITDTLYLSTQAVYLRDKKGSYIRLAWSDITDFDWILRKVKGQVVQAMVYMTADGRRIVVPMPFQFVPKYFGDIVDACYRELTPGGKTCKLAGPVRLRAYAHAPKPDSVLANKLIQDRIIWARELNCPCGGAVGFSLRYLGELLDSGLIGDGCQRQRTEATCKACGVNLELFDPYHHGYNAVICHESDTEPPGREARNDYFCRCGGSVFSLGVSAIFDADDGDIAGFSREKRSEAYGWLGAYAACNTCKNVTEVISYETA